MTEAGGAPQLSGEEKTRYARHITLPEVGVAGQQRLKAGSVLCIGAGGLGSPLLLYLAAAGVGRIGVVDDDLVEPSNLQRQVIHGTGTVGQAKTSSARSRIKDLNPFCRVEEHGVRLSASNALELVSAYDVVVDGTDNFASRYLINDACVLTKRPFVYGSVQRFEGQVSVFNLGSESPDYRDLVPEPPPQGLVPSCADGGVMGVMPGLIGLIQAAEVIKLITGIGTPLDGRLLLVDGLSMRFRELTLRRRPSRAPIEKLIDYQAFCTAGDSISGETSNLMKSISVVELKALLDQNQDLALIDVRNPAEVEVAVIAGSELIPLSTLESDEVIERIQAIAASQTVYVHCKLGGRSAKAVELLASHGIDAVNVEGGIDAWSEQIDPSVPRY
ncbi:molybdopterin-synthase adenylyltransferase MoeB [Synechococcus sp. WH 8016]|jgi:adenylyltransferase/sulfurtransferase|uniref:molybdopterin-synthase adenylyltransferase MoeB n=1 Tax=Synechococcus sp. WH 8016 TaxID=166318 RepID=UPI00022D7F55|nr:molybdopterin-synthase adenylyltransferase MoeB [Synechococcus sp. WH 8016]EHA59339.1 UBA/THIF-type NAD/FAD binding protein [Synechococcus sp. WH 8016]NKB72975.1 molybdopterin-synthase adenylyltransferase MoeB [Synechococcus sp. s2_metabat2_7]